jgi:hypothetical protein
VSADQIVQIVGALLILAGFILTQGNLLDANSSLYLVLNLAGATILAVLAFQGQRWGFVLLEGVWALVALASLILRLSGKEPAGMHEGCGVHRTFPRTDPDALHR